MPLEALRAYLEERKLINTDNLSLLQNYRIGIDATHWLNQIFAKENLSQAIGGRPLTLESAIKSQLSLYSQVGITPVWVFDGLPERGFLYGDALNSDAYEQGWTLYTEKKFQECRERFIEASKGLVASMSIFRHAFDILWEYDQEIFMAPTKSWSQLKHFLNSSNPLIHAIYGPLEILVHGAKRLITDINFEDGVFHWVDLKSVLDGIPGDHKEVTFNIACSRLPQNKVVAFESLLTKNDRAIKNIGYPSFSVYLTSANNTLSCVWDEGIMQSYSNLSIEVVWALSTGLLSPTIVYALIYQCFEILLPYSFPKIENFIIKHMGPILDDILSCFPQLRTSKLSSNMFKLKVNGVEQKGFPVSKTQFHSRSRFWTTKLEKFLNKEPAKPNSEASLGELSPELNVVSLFLISLKDAVLVSMDEINPTLNQIYFVIICRSLKCLQIFYGVSVNPNASPWGDVLSGIDPQFGEEAILLCFMLNSGYFDELIQSKDFEIPLLTQIFSLLKCEYVHQQWIGPIDKELFEFNIVTTLLTKTFNHLCQAILYNLFLREGGKYTPATGNFDHLIKVASKLPWKQEPSAIMGILLKAFLIEPLYKLKYRFPSCKSLKKSLERGLAFWNSFYNSFKNVMFDKGRTDLSEALAKADQFLKGYQSKLESLSD